MCLISCQFSYHVFPSLPAMKTILTRLQCCCERTTILDRHSEMAEPQGDNKQREGKEGQEFEGRGQRVTDYFV